MTSSLTQLRPPPTHPPPIPSLQASKRPSTAGYWVAAVVAVLGLMAAFLWGAVGITTTQDRVDGFDRLNVPGADDRVGDRPRHHPRVPRERR